MVDSDKIVDSKTNVDSDEAVEMKWFSLRVISGREQKIKENIFYELEDCNLQRMVENIFVPTEKVIEMRGTKKKIKEKTFFPGYILIKMTMTKESRYVVENTQGVLNFIGSKNQPVPLRDNEVRRIIGEVEKKEGQETLKTPFRVVSPCVSRVIGSSACGPAASHRARS